MEARELSPPNSQSIPPKSSSSLPMKSFFNSLYTVTKPQKKPKTTPNAVDLGMDLLLSSQAINHRGESAYDQLKPRTFANPTVTSKKVKISSEDCFFAQIYMMLAERSNDLTITKLSIFLSVADFANHAKFVFSWPGWVVYGFPIATKGSKPHSHQ